MSGVLEEAVPGPDVEVAATPRRRRSLHVNPVLRRELLERWRGRRAVLVLSLYVAAVGGLLLLLRWIGTTVIEQQQQWDPMAATAAGPMLGRFLFENLLALVLGLVLLVAPGYAAAQLSGERERRTLGLLRITLVRPRSIVLGKLGASSAWIVLLVLVTAPLAATAVVLGGVTAGDLLRGIVVILVVAVAVAAIALAVSSRARRTTGAVVTTYAIVVALVGGTVVAALAEYAVNDFDRIDPPVSLLLNPVYALADATNATPMVGGSELPTVLMPFAMMLQGREGWRRGGEVWLDDGVVEWPARDVPDVEWNVEIAPPVGMDDPVADDVPQLVAPVGEFPGQVGPARSGPPAWVITLGLYALLAAGALVIATRSIGPRDGVRET